jgi:lysophospholipase L1-like esterase
MNRLPSRTHVGRAAALVLFALAPTAFAAQGNLPWVGTWAVAPQKMNPVNYGGKTLREIVHTSVAGKTVRAHFSNLFGDTPLTIANAHVALRVDGSSVEAQTDTPLSFGGLPTVTLAPGESIVSDPAPFQVPAVSDVAVSFFVPLATNVATGHSFSNQSKYVADGDVAGSAAITAAEDGDYYFLTNLDVQGDQLRGSVVTFGASGTDGYQSTPNANKRWPNDLAVRATTAAPGLGILNQGISGNNLFNDGTGDQSAIKRFDRDALSQAGVRWVVFSDVPLNDFLNGVAEATAPNVIAAYQSLIDHTHSRGVKFMCATLSPFEGYRLYTPEAEARREAVNVFLRSPDSGCDAVVDFETALKDPAQPTHLLPAYDSGDHLHPNDAGYQALSDAVNLDLFPPPDPISAVAPTGCGVMNEGEGLTVGQQLVSCDGRFSLSLGQDGNVSVTMGTNLLISTGTAGSDAALLTLGQDGNLVLRGALGEPLWQANAPVTSPARMFMQNDANLVIYGLGGPVWSSGTRTP